MESETERLRVSRFASLEIYEKDRAKTIFNVRESYSCNSGPRMAEERVENVVYRAMIISVLSSPWLYYLPTCTTLGSLSFPPLSHLSLSDPQYVFCCARSLISKGVLGNSGYCFFWVLRLQSLTMHQKFSRILL